jgi:hypothetical protein
MSFDSASEIEPWNDRVQKLFERYDEALMRIVAGKLLRPRNSWKLEELIERCVETLGNAPVIDRRIKELPAASRKLLSLLGRSQQTTWSSFDLVWMLAAMNHVEGTVPIVALLETGLLYPILPGSIASLRSFDFFLQSGGPLPVSLFAHPGILQRARGEPLELPQLTPSAVDARAPRITDGTEFPLRIAVIWQQLAKSPMRLTQAQLFFKRDLLRLQSDELLKTPFAEHLIELPDSGVLMILLGIHCGVIASVEGELTAGRFAASWESGTSELLQALLASLWNVNSWNPIKGYFPSETGGVLPSMGLLLLALLQEQPAENWYALSALVEPFWKSHPVWGPQLGNKLTQGESWVQAFLLGIAYPLRLIELHPQGQEWFVRLSGLGRAILQGTPLPPSGFDFPQTLIVQPNGELVLYRQGLTPPLLSKLTRFADWKTLGAACTMELNAESVYRGLEAGVSLPQILKLLQQHATRALPSTVLDSLQRWSNKRERITLYSSATLIEFTSTEDLELAFQKGLIAQRLTERIGLIEGSEPDYRAFRLIGNRDYEARTQPCLHFDADGVTFSVDTALSDLVLEAELSRLAEQLESVPGNGRRFRLTRQSLKKAREQGITRTEFEQWAIERSGETLSPAAGLLFGTDPGQPGTVRTRVVLQLPAPSLVDGVLQFPATAALIEERLGPQALAVKADQLPEFLNLLSEFGLVIESR